MQRDHHTIDAAGKTFGRLASRAAILLQGKHSPSFTRHRDGGDYVEIKNFSLIKFTGNKMTQKLYYRPTRQPGKLRFDSLAVRWQKNPAQVLRIAVLGMLPKNSLRSAMIKRLSVKM